MSAAQEPNLPLDEILHDPSAVYSDPGAVLGETRFSRDEKQRILLQWRYDMQQLQVAAEENMAGDSEGADQLQTIDECLRQLSEGDAS